MLEGIARGGGAEFLTALDLRLAAADAVLGQPELALGLIPGAGGTARLGRLLGRGRALRLMLTGADVDAATAADIGWVDEIVPAGAVGSARTRSHGGTPRCRRRGRGGAQTGGGHRESTISPPACSPNPRPTPS